MYIKYSCILNYRIFLKLYLLFNEIHNAKYIYINSSSVNSCEAILCINETLYRENPLVDSRRI